MSDVEKLIDMLDDSDCRCHEAYRSRRMTDPNCNHDDAESWQALRTGVSELRRQLAEAEERNKDLAFQLDMKTAHYEERTAYVIVHNGNMLLCSDALRSAYSDVICALALAEQDARRYREFCDQAERGEFPAALLSDAQHMGAGTLDWHIDAAIAAGGGEE